MLATRGYAVLLPDAPQHLGTPMLDLAKTILPGVDKVISMGIADPDRLGVMGHSYGGYSVLSLIVQTVRFKAALEADGMGDLISGYGQMQRDGTAFLTSVIEQDQSLAGGLLGSFEKDTLRIHRSFTSTGWKRRCRLSTEERTRPLRHFLVIKFLWLYAGLAKT